MSKSIKKLSVLFVIMTLLAACETSVPDRNFSDLTYGHLAPLRINGGDLQITSNYHSPLVAPNVEHLFPVSPEKALRQWASDRLQVGDVKGMAQFVILDASVKETSLKTTKGMAGAFKLEQSERYDATIEARLDIIDYKSRNVGYAAAKVKRSITVREDASLNEREKIWFKLVENLMNDFDKEIEKNIHLHLSKWVK